MKTSVAASFEFRIDPSTEPDRVATCLLSMSVDGEPIWPVLGDVDAKLEIQSDDLLSHLSEFWKPLMLRQVYPAPFNPERPSRLRPDAQQVWAENPPETADREDEAVTAFEEAHDLARAFGGLFDLPPLWLMRAGDNFILETHGQLWLLPFEVVEQSLIRTGDFLATGLKAADPKWDELIEAWNVRNEADTLSLLALTTGLDMTTSRALVAGGLVMPPATYADAVNDNDEIRIAARLAGALPTDLLTAVLELARTFGKPSASALADLSTDCRAHIEERYAGYPPYVQGESAARKARELLGIGWDDPVDVFDIIHRLGAEIRNERVEPDFLDGLAIWGDNFGPGIFLNLASERVTAHDTASLEDDAAARVTAAHELCHLLLDGSHAVSAVDVLLSRMPVFVERRAKSFAGEFLLPSRTAFRWWEDMGSPQDRGSLGAVLFRLEQDFNVPRAVSSWKLDHGLQFHDIDLRSELSALSRWR